MAHNKSIYKLQSKLFNDLPNHYIHQFSRYSNNLDNGLAFQPFLNSRKTQGGFFDLLFRTCCGGAEFVADLAVYLDNDSQLIVNREAFVKLGPERL